MANDKYQLIIEAQDRATNNVLRLRKEFEKLGGEALHRTQLEAKQLQRKIGQLSTTTKKSTGVFSKFTKGIAIGNLAAMAAAKAASLLGSAIREIGEATLIAARVEVLNTTFRQMGQTAGIATQDLIKVKNSIIALGITEQNALGIAQRFIQANLDLADSTKIARLAQDAAVVAGVNSSEAALNLTDAINKQRPVLLKQYGIMINLNEVYKKYADEIGKSSDSLTSNQKKQALLNEVLKQGASLAGNYEAAMQDVGKRLTSLPRHVEAAQVAIGKQFTPVLEGLVTTAEDALKAIKLLFQTTEDGIIEIHSLAKAYEDKSKAMLETARRYDELSRKQKLSNEEYLEQQRLLKILSNYNKGAYNEFDKIGNVINVNTNAIREHILQQDKMWDGKVIQNIKDAKGVIKEMDSELAAIDFRIQQLIDDPDKFKVFGIGEDADDAIERLKQLKSSLNLTKSTFIATYHPVEDFDELVQLLGLHLAADVRYLYDLANAANRAASALPKIKIPKPLEDDDPDINMDPPVSIDEMANLDAIYSAQEYRIAAIRDGFDRERAETQLYYDREATHFKNLLDFKEISQEEYNEVMLAMEQSRAAEMQEIADAELQDAMTRNNVLNEMFMTTSGFINTGMEDLLDNIGIISGEANSFFEQMVVSLANYGAQVALKAIQTAIYSKLEKKAISAVSKERKKATLAVIAETSATAANTAVNIAAMPVRYAELAVTKALTKQYIALAAAKTAVNPLSGPGRVAAAAATKGALDALLGGVFDDPINDANLIKENRRIARFIIEGQTRGAQDMAAKLQRKAEPEAANVSVGDIIIQGNADSTTIEQLDAWKDEFLDDVRNGFIPMTTTENRSRR